MAFVDFLKLLSLVFCFTVFHVNNGEEDVCSVISAEERAPCEDTSDEVLRSQSACESAGCCWHQPGSNSTTECYQKQCSPGYFGWGCKFRCNCLNGEPCNAVTGNCEAGCVRDRWGIGCLLENDCTYNDGSGQHYMGKKTKTEDNRTCVHWVSQRAYPASQFPDKDFGLSVNYCRNPKPLEARTWCYWTRSSPRKWGYCSLRPCECPPGRFSVNCQLECHCHDPNEICSSSGECVSGCHPHWTGSSCQECNNGYFGAFCRSQCHCIESDEACDKTTGACQSGCAHGWKGDGCQTECEDNFYGLNCDYKCNCQSSEVCNKSTGSCFSGCKDGFAGDGCQIELPVMTRMPELDTRNGTSISIRWRDWSNPPDGGTGPVVGYVVYYQVFGEDEWREALRTTSKVAIISQLSVDQKYYFRVAAIHQTALVGIPSPGNMLTTCGRPLSGPIRLRLEVKSLQSDDEDYVEDYQNEEQITLALYWDLPSRDQSNCVSLRRFNIYRRSASSESLEMTFVQNSVMARRAFINNVDPYVNLTVGVSFVNNAFLESNIERVTYIGRSSAVSHIEVVSKSSSSMLVRWSVPSASNALIEFYLLSYREVLVGELCDLEPKPWSPMIDVDRTEIEIGELRPHSKYEVKVWPQTSAGRGRVAVTSATTDAAEPAAVQNLTLVSVTATTALLSWQALGCLEFRGQFIGYTYDLVQESSRLSQTTVNGTDVLLMSLIPFTNYSVDVWFTNHQYHGPSSRIHFTTSEDVPPSPRNVFILTSLTHSLSVEWDIPYPPHGIITGYFIKFYLIGGLSIAPTTVHVNQTVQKYNLTDLEPNNTYGIQIAAETKVGMGPWSGLIEGYTDESVPSEPRNFVNISRTSTSMVFSWQPPLVPGGILQLYKLTCIPLFASSKLAVSTVEERFPSSVNKATLSDMHPGIRYQCFLRASTKKGFGLSTMKEVWTEPSVNVNLPKPRLDSSKTSDVTRAIAIQPFNTNPYSDEADSVFRVVVERATSSHRPRRQSSSSPCDVSNSELRDYQTATKLGDLCYIAAELVIFSNEIMFIVGDNKTYGGYYNAPLMREETYHIWFGLVITIDGVTASSYVSTMNYWQAETSVVSQDLDEPVDSAAAMAGAAIGAILAVIIIVFAIVCIAYKSGFIRRNQLRVDSERDNLQSFDTSDPADTISKIRGDKGRLGDRSAASEEVEEVSEARAELVPLCAASSSKLSTSASQILHHSVTVDDLWNYVSVKKASRTGGLRQEYEVIPQGLQFKCETARKLENKTKNRYGNIVAYDHSRVALICADDIGTDYINANYIDGYNKKAAFVATQGPSKHTLNDMWRMVWQLRSTRIVMVSNLTEDGRHKCEQYWPDSELKQYGEIRVETSDVEHFADFKIRTFTVSKNDVKMTVRQFHFTAWPDHGVPAYPTSLLAFHKKFRSYDDTSAGPPVVHCSAGVGRTGTFIALDYLLEQAKKEGKVNVWEFVKHMRTQRVNMVQTPEQYIFVYDALLESLKCGDTSIPCVDFRGRHADLLKVNTETGKTYMLEEYELLSTMTQESAYDKSKVDGLKAENINKNRDVTIVPITKLCRPFLRTYIAGSTDYINAVFADGYKQRDAFIVTQAPLVNTIVDFWTLIYDQSCRTVVMMNEPNCTDKTLGEYFPTSFGSHAYGPFSVELVAVDSTNSDLIIRDFRLTFSKRATGSEPLLIRHFEFLAWSVDSCLPTNKFAMLTLLNMLEKWQQRSGNRVILVHCLDGATRSGFLCALSYMVERLKVEQDVDVFQSVKHTRTNRSQIIPSFEQYEYLYEMAVEYMDCFDAYANFK